jgi:CrcB protein
MTLAGIREPAVRDLRLFVMVGLCGGFTTFSSFSLQTLDLLLRGAPIRAAANIAFSVVLCVAAVALGHYAAAGIAPARPVKNLSVTSGKTVEASPEAGSENS